MNADFFAVECRNLEKSFGSRLILRDICLAVKRGEILALIGSNGAGKTTLLKILASLILPSGGNASILGEDVSANPSVTKKSIGFISSEERSFYWQLTGRQNLKFFASLHGSGQVIRNQEIDCLLTRVGLPDQGDVRFREYSTGMKQALGMARALLHDPPVLLLDEPTRSLSPDKAVQIRQLILEKTREGGKSVLLATHNFSEAEELADRIAILHKGAILAAGTLAELRGLAACAQAQNLDTLFDFFVRKRGSQ